MIYLTPQERANVWISNCRWFVLVFSNICLTHKMTHEILDRAKIMDETRFHCFHRVQYLQANRR